MKKILIISLLFITIMNSFYYCFAFEIGTKEIIPLGECESLLTYNGNPVKTIYVVYEKEGTQYPAYCLDADLLGVVDKSYSVNGASKLQNVDAWKAIINGYPYKSVEELGAANEREAFTATKQAVYTMLYGRDTSSYAPVDSEAGRRTYQIYLNIVNNAKNSNDTIVNELSTNIVCNNKEWAVDEINENYISKVYSLNSNLNKGNYKIELSGTVPQNTLVTDLENKAKTQFLIGEKFKILIPIESLFQSENFSIKAISSLETKPVVYGSSNIPGRQNYALTGCMYEDSETTYTEGYFENITKLIVEKKEYGTDKRLQGVKFNLLNSKKEIIYENLTTDKNGEIILDKMIPGLYYLQETETLENYNLYTDLIEIDLDLNEEFKVSVDNTTKEIIEYNKTFEIVEVVPTYEETHFNQETIVKKLPVTGY